MMEFPGVFSLPVLVAVFALLVVFLGLFLQTFRQKRHRLPPGPPGLPFFGNFFTLLFSRIEQHELIDKWAKEYGDVCMYRIFGTRFVILNDFRLTQEAFLGQDIHERSPILPCNQALGRPNTSLGIIGSDDGQDWKQLRKHVHNRLRNIKQKDVNYESLVTSQAQRFIDAISEHRGSYFDPRDGIYVTVANVTNTILTGKTYDYDDEEFIHFTEIVADVFEYMAVGAFNYHVPILASLPSKTKRKGDVAFKKMFAFIADIIKRCRESNIFDNDDEPTNFIESFLKEQQLREQNGNDATFNDANIIQLTWDLYFGGIDTVSVSLCWIFLLMAQHPDVQSKVQAELDQVAGRERMPTFGDRSRMPFAEAAIAESYRISAMILNTIPHRGQKNAKIKGYDIPAGTFVTVNTRWLSLSPDVWDNPTEFRPERFIDEAGKFDSKLEAKLAKFGIGRRSCVGEQLARTELFIFFTHVLHRFTLRLPDGMPISMAGIHGLLYKPVPYKIRAIPRNP